jgi:hypothetical protein
MRGRGFIHPHWHLKSAQYDISRLHHTSKTMALCRRSCPSES